MVYYFHMQEPIGRVSSMEMQKMYQLAEEYKKELVPLLSYLNWLESHRDKTVSSRYKGDNIEQVSLSFPVYDATLMMFIKEAGKTSFMDKNYAYIYTRNRIQNPQDEKRFIEKATIKEWDILCGILTKYVVGGRVQASLWSQGMKEDIFYLVINKMKSIVEYWDVPIDIT